MASTAFDCTELKLEAYEMYFKALTGANITIEEFEPETKFPFPDTLTTLRLPKCVEKLAKPIFFQIALAHRAQRITTSTFKVDVSAIVDSEKLAKLDDEVNGFAESPLEQFFRCFADKHLAQFIYQCLDDMKIDLNLPHYFPGLTDKLGKVMKASLSDRPVFTGMVPKAAAMELLLQASLGHRYSSLPEPIVEAGSEIYAIFDAVNFFDISQQSVLDAAVRIYSCINGLPSLGRITGTDNLADIDINPRRVKNSWPNPWPEPARTRIEGDDILEVTVPQVAYRGSIEALIAIAPAAAGPDHQALYRLSKLSNFSNSEPDHSGRPKVDGPPEPLPHEHHDLARELHHHEEGELHHKGGNSYLYPEWDMYQHRYRKNWCRVIEEKPLAATDGEKVSLQVRYAKELNRLRRVMEIPNSNAFTPQRRRSGGPDLDYDAAVDAMIDLRSGMEPSENIYIDLVRKKRDVAILILIDISASTAERVENAEPILLDLSGLPGQQVKERPPRILDLEIISSLLCSNALEGVGDAFSIWAFSGTGREHVILSEIKPFNQSMSGVVVSKAAALKPVHATRLGTAVRHCGKVLGKIQAETKLLLVLTDGRPYDTDYGTSYGETESQSYAIADSDMAFKEIMEMAIDPYVLTIDAQGEEYISQFTNVQVDVLKDVNQLPERLLRLYLNLVVGQQSYKSHVRTAESDQNLLQKVVGKTSV